MNPEFVIRLDAESLGRLFMPRASTFEVLQASVVQEQFVVDAVGVQSETGKCRLIYSEWEEDADDPDNKLWVSEYSIELTIGDLVAFGTYSTSFTPEQREAGLVLDQLKREAEDDFILCAKLLGRSVRRDLVIDEDMPDRPKPGSNLH